LCFGIGLKRFFLVNFFGQLHQNKFAPANFFFFGLPLIQHLRIGAKRITLTLREGKILRSKILGGVGNFNIFFVF
jgi:hypothetical protein